MLFFFFNDTATTEIYTLSLHDALPIWFWHAGQPADDVGGHRGVGGRRGARGVRRDRSRVPRPVRRAGAGHPATDRKSTRLNSSHANISYAVFCLKKKIQTILLNKIYIV